MIAAFISAVKIVVCAIAYISITSWAFRYATRKSRANRFCKEKHPTIVLFDDVMPDMQEEILRRVKEDHNQKPLILSKLPHDIGDHVVTIAKCRFPEDGKICIERVDHGRCGRVECICKATPEACCAAITQVLAA